MLFVACIFSIVIKFRHHGYLIVDRENISYINHLKFLHLKSRKSNYERPGFVVAMILHEACMIM